MRDNPVSSCGFKVKARLFTGFAGGEDLQKNVYLHFMCLASGSARQGRFSEKKKNVMTEISKQRTLKGPVSLSGVGLHSGRMAHVTLKPAPEDSWFVFKRVDLPGQPEIRALAENVVDTARGTTLEENGARVSTVEHVLSALAGLELDNVLIETDSAEMPILDGSSRLVAEAILQAGICEQQAERVYYVPRAPMSFSNPKDGIELKVLPSGKREFTVKIDYGSSVIVPQFAHIEAFGENYVREVASCRTFVFLREVEWLYSHNLIKGGDLSNAIVFVDRMIDKAEMERLANLLGKPAVEVRSEGILNNVDLYFKNEPARHKMLDVIGDFALLGRYMRASVDALRPGHFSNTEFAKAVRKQMQKDMAPEALPDFDITAKPLYDITAIRKILPHRPPFLLVDKIVYMDKDQVVGVKNVTMNEPFFVGHFPEEPVMPGVLIVEAMAQTGGIYMLTQYPDPENYLTYFLKIDQVKFRHKVVPGDTLIFKLSPVSPLRRGLCNMRAWAYVGNQVVAEAEMLAQLSRKPDAPELSK